MGLPLNVVGSKRLLIQTLSLGKRGGSVFQVLLDGLSAKELRILRKHEDLSDRVLIISKTPYTTLLNTIKESYGLLVENYHSGGVWISTELLQDSIPDWHKSTHSGWYLTANQGEFEVWARHFLMQEVRINIWLRYVEHKKNSDRREASPRCYPGMHV